MQDTKTDIEKPSPPLIGDDSQELAVVEIINVSGHPQELDRNFGFWSICAISIVADNAWAAGSGSLVSSSITRNPAALLRTI